MIKTPSQISLSNIFGTALKPSIDLHNFEHHLAGNTKAPPPSIRFYLEADDAPYQPAFSLVSPSSPAHLARPTAFAESDLIDLQSRKAPSVSPYRNTMSVISRGSGIYSNAQRMIGFFGKALSDSPHEPLLNHSDDQYRSSADDRQLPSDADNDIPPAFHSDALKRRDSDLAGISSHTKVTPETPIMVRIGEEKHQDFLNFLALWKETNTTPQTNFVMSHFNSDGGLASSSSIEGRIPPAVLHDLRVFAATYRQST